MLKALALLMIGILAVAVTLVSLASQMGTEYTEMAQGVASVSVALGFFGCILIMMAYSDLPTGTNVIGASFCGIILAFILQTLNNNGVLIDEFVTGSITIGDVMTVTVIFWVLVGIIIEVAKK